MKSLVFIIPGILLLFGSEAFATTYYIDFASGRDANNGTSKTAPWQHAPGMRTCTSVCASTTIQGGDSIILKGGVTWPNASFMWSLPSGSTGNPVYIGVDKTWYTGTSWTRPILDAGGVAITNNYDTMFGMGPNTTIDNFEIKGFYWDNTACAGGAYGTCGIFNAGQNNGQTWENLYIHGWTHAGTDALSSNGVATIIATGGGGNSIAHDNVIVGTDVPGDHSINVFFNGPPVAYNNYIKQVSSAFIVTYATSVHDNHIEDVGPAYCNMPFPQYAGHCSHENGFEDNGSTGLSFYNNVITNISAGLAVWIAPNPGYTVTMWNNVIYGVHDNQVLDMAPPVYNASLCPSGPTANHYCTAAGSYVFENNTVQCGDDSTLYDMCQSNIGVIGSGAIAQSMVFRNNHFISATTNSGCATGTGAASSCTFASNVVHSLSTANSQGYSSSQVNAFSPTTSSSSTVGVGINLISSASGSVVTLGSDTTYGCRLGAENQPACPRRATTSRPITGAWDAGAYQYRTSATGPMPPAALVAAAQ